MLSLVLTSTARNRRELLANINMLKNEIEKGFSSSSEDEEVPYVNRYIIFDNLVTKSKNEPEAA